MVKVILYGYCTGVRSSRKIERATYEDVGFRILAAGQHPDHDTIAEFRRRFLRQLSELFNQVLELCRRAGLVRLGHVALDGTKIKANASKHKAMSYGRMCEKEREFEQIVKRLMEEAERIDQEEDRRYGKGKRGDELPEELRFHKSRLKKIREAKRALEEEAKAKALMERKKKEHKEKPEGTGRGRKKKNEEEGEVSPRAQRNFTDPDSRIMKDSATKEFIQGYNAQLAVDEKAQVIVACDVVQSANDKKQLEPMVELVEENTGQVPEQVSADAGYFSEESIMKLEEKGIDLYVSPDRLKHERMPPAAKGRIPANVSIKERMRRKLRTKRGREKYSKRKETVEPVCGQIKEARGIRRFLLRGLQRVRAEWKIICLTHNILKLFRCCWGARWRGVCANYA